MPTIIMRYTALSIAIIHICLTYACHTMNALYISYCSKNWMYFHFICKYDKQMLPLWDKSPHGEQGFPAGFLIA